MKNKIINLMLILTVIAVLTVFAFFVRVGTTADSVVVLRTLGMTCESCTDKITSVLAMRNGVASTRVDMDAGRVVVWYDSHAVRPEILARSLTGAGYGSSIVVNMSADKYRAITGTTGGTQSGGMAGCGGRCRTGKK